MKFHFPHSGLDSVKAVLEDVVQSMKLPVDVKITVDGENLVVKIVKMGTSTLYFKKSGDLLGVSLGLDREDISMWHKGSIEEVKSAFVDIVERAGGSVFS